MMLSHETDRTNNILPPAKLTKQAHAKPDSNKCVQVLPSHCIPEGARTNRCSDTHKNKHTQTHTHTQNNKTKQTHRHTDTQTHTYTHSIWGGLRPPVMSRSQNPRQACVCAFVYVRVRACVYARVRCMWCYTHSRSQGRRHQQALNNNQRNV